MFTQNKSLQTVETLLHGYCAGLQTNRIEEDYDGRKFHPREFSGWLFDDTGWSGARGFANAIEENTGGPDAAFETFFELVQRFRWS